MSIQVQKFVLEVQWWRTFRIVETFTEAEEIMRGSRWGEVAGQDEWDEYGRIGQVIQNQVRGFTDLVALVNMTGQIIIRTERHSMDPKGTIYIAIRDGKVALDISSYWEAKGTYPIGEVPYDGLRQAVSGVHQA